MRAGFRWRVVQWMVQTVSMPTRSQITLLDVHWACLLGSIAFRRLAHQIEHSAAPDPPSSSRPWLHRPAKQNGRPTRAAVEPLLVAGRDGA